MTPRGHVRLRRWVQAIGLGLFLVLVFYVSWPYGAEPTEDAVVEVPGHGTVPAHFAMERAGRELVPAELYLMLDPLVALSATIARRAWVVAAWGALSIVLLEVLIPRVFCGYLCPLGTLIDTTDHLLKRVTRRLRLRSRPWAHLRFALLVVVLCAAGAGILLSRYLSAIPIVTRGMVFTVAPLQSAVHLGWRLVPPYTGGMAAGALIFAGVLALGLLAPRFWCRYVCPSGALFSLLSLANPRKRHVSDQCIQCRKCLKACTFDAIRGDFHTLAGACTLCHACGAACPVDAISFSTKKPSRPRPATDPTSGSSGITRRHFLGTAAAGAGAVAIAPCTVAGGDTPPLVRPPGSLPEDAFAAACIGCGACLQACPNHVLQSTGLDHGLAHLWSPKAVLDWAGCEPSCNNCGQVCPTGAIRALPLEEKRVVRMGLAEIDLETCLPWAEGVACDLCVEDCRASGYDAIEVERNNVQVDEDGFPIDGTGVLAPVVVRERCVGCGLCQSRCHAINVKQQHMLRESAIQVQAGDGRDDRIRSGSYLALREAESRRQLEAAQHVEFEAFLE